MSYTTELLNNNSELEALLNDFNELPEAVKKPTVFTPGNIPIFDNNGNIQDSGKTTDNIGDSSSNIPMYSYGTEDLVAGSSPLEHGKLYFVYE